MSKLELLYGSECWTVTEEKEIMKERIEDECSGNWGAKLAEKKLGRMEEKWMHGYEDELKMKVGERKTEIEKYR